MRPAMPRAVLCKLVSLEPTYTHLMSLVSSDFDHLPLVGTPFDDPLFLLWVCWWAVWSVVRLVYNKSM